MEIRKFSPRFFFVSICLVFLAFSGGSSLAHDESDSCDDACKAARYEKYKQWKAEHPEAKESDKEEKDKSADAHDESDQAESDQEGQWTEEERAAWREKWKNFDFSKFKIKHGDPGHVCRRGINKARSQIDQIDKTTDTLVKDQLDAVAEAREAVGNTSGITGAAPAERAAYAVKMRRDIDRIEDKIVKGRPVSRKEIARIPNRDVRGKLMKALEAQTKVENLEQEREQTVKTMKVLEKVAVSTAKAEVDMSSLQKDSVGLEKRPENAAKPANVLDRGGQSAMGVSLSDSGMQEKFEESDSNRGHASRSKLREALRQRMRARNKDGELDTEILFDGHLNMPAPKDDYVAFTGEIPKKAANLDLISLDVFQPIKTGRSLAGPETEAEVKRISMEVAVPEIIGKEAAPAQNRAPAAESSAEEPRYLDAAILSRNSLSLFERVKHFHDACLLKKCVSGIGKRGLRAAE